MVPDAFQLMSNYTVIDSIMEPLRKRGDGNCYKSVA
jgi:hypothetical protein